jgi:DNA replicative helicase MCM subunit Mcm2 (Cdc46/Mcm family)
MSTSNRLLSFYNRLRDDDIKEMMLRALESSERAHTLLTGPPACSKSLFMLLIEKFMQSKVYFAEGAGTSKAGLQKFVRCRKSG